MTDLEKLWQAVEAAVAAQRTWEAADAAAQRTLEAWEAAEAALEAARRTTA